MNLIAFESLPADQPPAEPVAAAAEPAAPPTFTPPVFVPPAFTPAVGASDRRAQTTPSAVTLARVGDELLAWFKTLASAAVYATLIVTFGFQVARVEGESMAPTLQDQDRLLVNKAAYRLHKPNNGDIVMLLWPVDPGKSFVKRIIAGPGESVRSVNGRLFRTDVEGREVALSDAFIPENYRASGETWTRRTVPAGHYFVMGDHRNNSSDSRTWDWVPEKYIIGRIELRWWPVNNAKIFTDVLDPQPVER